MNSSKKLIVLILITIALMAWMYIRRSLQTNSSMSDKDPHSLSSKAPVSPISPFQPQSEDILIPDESIAEPKQHKLNSKLPHSPPTASQTSWTEPFPSLNTYSWIFLRLGGTPEEKEKLRKFDKDPYDGLLDKLIDIGQDKLVTISNGTTFDEIKNALSSDSAQHFSFQDSHLIPNEKPYKNQNSPICILNIVPNFDQLSDLNKVHFFVDRVVHPITTYPGFTGMRLQVRPTNGSQKNFGLESVDCITSKSSQLNYKDLKVVHLLMILGSDPYSK